MSLHETILFMRDGGKADMGSVTDEADRLARFAVPEGWGRMAVVNVRIHFRDLTGSATGTAVCVMHKDSGFGLPYDAELLEWAGNGSAEDGVLRNEPNDMPHYVIEKRDWLVFEWTNPDSGNINWSVEIGVVPA